MLVKSENYAGRLPVETLSSRRTRFRSRSASTRSLWWISLLPVTLCLIVTLGLMGDGGRMAEATLLTANLAATMSADQRSDNDVVLACAGADDTQVLKTAVAEAGSGWVVISAGNICAASDISLNNVRIEPGGLLKPLSGRTIIIEGNFEAGPFQTFTNALASQGTIAFGPGSTSKQLVPQWWGAVADSGGAGNGTDSSAPFQAAIIAAANRTLFLPHQPRAYRITRSLRIGFPEALVSEGATVLFDFPASATAAEGRLFDVQASSVQFKNIRIDGGGVVSRAISGNRYAIIIDNGTTVYKNITIQNCVFGNFGSYAGTLPATSSAMHAIYASYTDNLRVEDCLFDALSGSAVQINHAVSTAIAHNVANRIGWYAFNLTAANVGSKIMNNTIKGSTAAAPVYWGGGIDLMGQTSATPGGGAGDREVIISGNYLSGTYKYTAAIRVASASYVTISDNIFDQCEVSSIQPNLDPITYPTNSSLIVITARDVNENNGPSNHITIRHNTAMAKGRGQKFVSATTTSGSAINRARAEGLIIDDNQVKSVDSTNYFAALLALSAAPAGYEEILVEGNYFTGAPVVNTVANLYDGAVAFTATAGKPAQRIQIMNNKLSFFPQASIPTGAEASNNAIYLEQYCDGATIRGNTIVSFGTGLYLNRHAGLSLGISGIGSDILSSVASPLTIVDSSTKVFGQLTGVLVVPTPTQVGAGNKTTLDIKVVGAKPGDTVTIAPPSAGLSAIIESLLVSSDNNVKIVIYTPTAAVDIGGVWIARVLR